MRKRRRRGRSKTGTGRGAQTPHPRPRIGGVGLPGGGREESRDRPRSGDDPENREPPRRKAGRLGRRTTANDRDRAGETRKGRTSARAEKRTRQRPDKGTTAQRTARASAHAHVRETGIGRPGATGGDPDRGGDPMGDLTPGRGCGRIRIDRPPGGADRSHGGAGRTGDRTGATEMRQGERARRRLATAMWGCRVGRGIARSGGERAAVMRWPGEARMSLRSWGRVDGEGTLEDRPEEGWRSIPKATS